jgi:hypothetical protein
VLSASWSKRKTASGATEECLAVVDRHISDGAASILKQTEIVAKRKRDGDEYALAESFLQTSKMIQAIFEEFRAAVRKSRESALRPSFPERGWRRDQLRDRDGYFFTSGSRIALNWSMESSPP